MNGNKGPLAGRTVLEVGGIGPMPFAGMILADLGAEVVRIDRPGARPPMPLPPERDLMNRGKRTVALDLKSPSGVEALEALVVRSDALIEGYRPGVAERLGFGPQRCLDLNPALVYGRMTGWGQEGPWSARAGHDVNYISATGALNAIGTADGPPQVPLNLLGDFGGGSTYLVMGVLAALLEAQGSGRGQVVDAAIVDGVSHLLACTHSLMNSGLWDDGRGVNVLDGSAPYYRLYETSDGRYMSVGAIEPQFYARMLELLGVEEDLGHQHDRSAWPRIQARLEETFSRRTQAEWGEVFERSDACVTPVVSLAEAVDHPQIRARGSITRQEGRLSPAPAPRFSRTVAETPAPPKAPGSDTVEILRAAGVDVDGLLADGVAVQA